MSAADNVPDLIRRLKQLNLQQEDIQKEQAQIIQQLEGAETKEKERQTKPQPTKQQTTKPQPNRSASKTEPQPDRLASTTDHTSRHRPRGIKPNDWVRIKKTKHGQPTEAKVVHIGAVFITVEGKSGDKVWRAPRNLQLVRRASDVLTE